MLLLPGTGQRGWSMGILDGTGLQYRPARLENLSWLLIVLIPIGPWVSLNCRPLAPSIHTVAMCIHTLSLSVPASQVPILQMWEELPSTVTHLYSETSWVAKGGKLSFSFRQQNGLLDFLYEHGPYFPVVRNIPYHNSQNGSAASVSDTHWREPWPYSAGCKNH